MSISGLKSYGVLLPAGSKLTTAAFTDLLINELTLTREDTSFEAKAFVDGVTKTIDTVITEQAFTATFNFQVVDASTIELMTGEAWADTTSVVFPTLKKATVPASTYTITDTDLAGVAYNNDKLSVTLLSTNTGDDPVACTLTNAAPTAIDEVEVDVAVGPPATNDLVFHSSAAGRTAAYVIQKTYSTVKSIGVETVYETLTNGLSWFGMVAGPRFGGDIAIRIPSMDKSTGFEMGFTTEFSASLEYKPGVTGTNRAAVQFYQL